MLNRILNKLIEIKTTRDEQRQILGLSDNIKFSDYSKYFSPIETSVEVNNSKFDFNVWQFKKEDDDAWQEITLPHTINQYDCKSYYTGTNSMFRGICEYKQTIELDEDYDYFLTLEQSILSAKIYFDNEEIHHSTSGFLPTIVKLPNASGEHTIIVKTDNTVNYDIIPLSVDVSMTNGLVGLVFIRKLQHIYIDPIKYGIDRAHIRTLTADENLAKLNVKFSIFSDVNTQVSVNVKLVNGDNVVASTHKSIKLHTQNNDIELDLEVENPKIWRIKEGYCYNVVIEVINGANILDSEEILFGIRTIQRPSRKYKPIRINGIEHNFRGFSIHQDAHDRSSALTHEDWDEKIEDIKELGMNYARLAHYPHNIYFIKELDKAGIAVQTEIPWVNDFWKDCSEAYKENIKRYAKEMVTHLYNRPSIILWGIQNEIGNNAPITPATTTKYNEDEETVILLTNLMNDCIKIIKEIDNDRFVGCACTSGGFTAVYQYGVAVDWLGLNIYTGWYGGILTENNTVEICNNANGSPLYGITEYGFGNDPNYHGEDYLVGNRNSNGVINTTSRKHYEEYATLGHLRCIENIYKNTLTPSTLNSAKNQFVGNTYYKQFTSSWVMYDFASFIRKEGAEDFINDKGIITRDRTIKKDAFYMYKAMWNEEPMLFLAEKRWTQRNSQDLRIRVFSNLDSVSFYVNDELIETLTQPTYEYAKVWELIVPFSEDNRTLNVKVSGSYTENEETHTIEDNATFNSVFDFNQHFITTSQQYLIVDNNENDETISINATGKWRIYNCPEWITISPMLGNGGQNDLQITISENSQGTYRFGKFRVQCDDYENTYVDILVTQYEKRYDYLKLNSVESGTNYAYFDLGFIPTENTIIDARASLENSTAEMQLYGTRSTTDAGAADYYLWMSKGTIVNACIGTAQTGNTTLLISNFSDVTIHHSNTGITVNNYKIDYASPAINPLNSTYTMWLGTRNNMGKPAGRCYNGLKLYYMIVHEGEQLSYIFVPNENGTIKELVHDTTLNPSKGNWMTY